MPNYHSDTERVYFEDRKKSDLHWTQFLHPDYAGTIKSQKEFEQLLIEGNHEIVSIDQREFIPTYMYHHDLKYTSLRLRVKENAINIAFFGFFIAAFALLFFLMFHTRGTMGEPLPMSPVDVLITAILALGLILGGIGMGTKGITIYRVAALLLFTFGSCIILFRKEIAIALNPYISPKVLLISILIFLIMFLFILKKRKS